MKKIVLYKKIVLISIVAIAVMSCVVFYSIYSLKSCNNVFLNFADLPEVKYGEFPFKVTFKIDGEIKTVEDVYVCEYTGIGIGSNGIYTRWKSYIKSTGYDYIVLKEDGIFKLICSVGSPYYYMNDTTRNYQPSEPEAVLSILNTTNGGQSGDVVEIKQEYGVEVLDYKFSEPILM